MRWPGGCFADKYHRRDGIGPTSENAQDHNGFDRPDTVRPVEFKDFKIKDGKLIVKMPPISIISISAKL